MTLSAFSMALRSSHYGAAIAGILWGVCMFPDAAYAVKASYRCEKGVTFDVDFTANGKKAVLFLPGGLDVPLARAASASGFRFNGGGYDLHGKDPSALLTRPEGDTITCRLLPRKRTQAAKEAPAAEPPPTGPSFDCGGDLNETQQRICANSLLSELDGRMASIYAGLRKKLKTSARSRLREEQKTWLAERDKCGKDDSCIEDHYYGRNAYLEEYEDLGAAPPPPPIVVPSSPSPQATPATPAAPAAPAVPVSPGSPAAQTLETGTETPAAAAMPALPYPGQSWGGLVRSGPGTKYRKVGSLKEGDPLVLLEDTGVELNGYNWFKIEYRGRTGYQWGGLICAKGREVKGAFKICE